MEWNIVKVVVVLHVLFGTADGFCYPHENVLMVCQNNSTTGSEIYIDSDGAPVNDTVKCECIFTHTEPDETQPVFVSTRKNSLDGVVFEINGQEFLNSSVQPKVLLKYGSKIIFKKTSADVDQVPAQCIGISKGSGLPNFTITCYEGVPFSFPSTTSTTSTTTSAMVPTTASSPTISSRKTTTAVSSSTTTVSGTITESSSTTVSGTITESSSTTKLPSTATSHRSTTVIDVSRTIATTTSHRTFSSTSNKTTASTVTSRATSTSASTGGATTILRGNSESTNIDQKNDSFEGTIDIVIVVAVGTGFLLIAIVGILTHRRKTSNMKEVGENKYPVTESDAAAYDMTENEFYVSANQVVPDNDQNRQIVMEAAPLPVQTYVMRNSAEYATVSVKTIRTEKAREEKVDATSDGNELDELSPRQQNDTADNVLESDDSN